MSARWAKGDPRALRILIVAAAVICMPPLVYHIYDGYLFEHSELVRRAPR